MTKKLLLCVTLFLFTAGSFAQRKPCDDPKFRQLDFWIGQWDAYGKNGKKAGTSRISLILDSCVILEEWESASTQNNVIYKGKSFNGYNVVTRQWQQTWIDNTGNTTEFLRGTGTEGQIVYYADKVPGAGNTFYMRRLTFTKLDANKVRQLGEKSDDQGKTWTVEYDLEYRRRQ